MIRRLTICGMCLLCGCSGDAMPHAEDGPEKIAENATDDSTNVVANDDEERTDPPSDNVEAVDALAAAGATFETNERGNVEVVNFVETDNTADNETLALLMDLPELWRVNLYGLNFGDAGMESLAALPKLRRLELVRSSVTHDGIAILSVHATLESLNLNQAPKIGDESLAHIAKMPNIREVRLVKTGVTDAGVAHLANTTTLVSLDLRQTQITDGCFASLSGLENLKSLRCQGTGSLIKPEGIPELAVVTSLTVLGLDNCAVDDDALAALAPLVKLEQLHLYRADVTDDGLRTLANFPGLRVLALRESLLDGTGLSHLASLSNLQQLDLSESPVSNEGAVALGQLTSLENLGLWDAEITDEGFAQLSGLTKLRVLNVDGLNLTDSSMDIIAGFSALQELNLAKTRITDAGLDKLHGLTTLKLVNIKFCPSITQQGIQALQAALPDVQVEQ